MHSSEFFTYPNNSANDMNILALLFCDDLFTINRVVRNDFEAPERVKLDSLYQQAVTDSQYIDAIAQGLSIAQADQNLLVVADGGLHRIALCADDGQPLRFKAILFQLISSERFGRQLQLISDH